MHSVADLVRLNARRHPDREAVVDGRVRRTHAELSARAWALARGLLELGIRPGEAVGVLSGNSVFSAETFLGVVAAGAAYVPYNWRWATPEMVFGVNDSRARVVLVERDFREKFGEVEATGKLEHVAHVIYEDDGYEALLRPGGAPDVAVTPEDIACILYTGGTTGFSKGVLLSHRAILTNALNETLDCAIGREPDDRGLITTPMFHAAALLCWFLPHYLTGACSVFLRRFDEEEVGWLVARERITNFFLIPNMIRRLLKAGTFETEGFRRYFRAMHTGGAALRMPDKLAVREVLPEVKLYYRYGLTEAGPMVTRLQPHDVFRPEADGSIGREYLLTEVQLQAPDGSEVAVGEVGEICVRGPNVMTGYLNRPDATAEALRGGWLHTGDLAVRDEEGYLYFRDRSKDMIKTGGENVYCAEIEQLLYAHPAVMEAAVLGVPSSEWDEEVRAVVSLRPGQELDQAALVAYLRDHLAGYKIPKQIAFLPPESMPINPSGKIVKARVRELLGW
ncbi:fatty-acid--CoA ligase [Carbonactinospora thermoautotrophica]|uniref:class I adenylate-forming enzyme family protein n=1 Tax=Carbonactinospora thermoautotrophica TaxID=1469144 RepID=UPI00226E2640|nr:AMP-binding protein [Carbonactinospora thermoautotrophica]MCX9192397.1 fatty-acid--CoA ligase [Carbonactinospora thermoautotrophica]